MLETEYYPGSGRMPAYEFIKNQSPEVIEIILKEIERLEKYGLQHATGDGKVKKIYRNPTCPMYELRVKHGLEYRLLFTTRKSVCWYVSGFIKKDRKTPKSEMDKAIKRAKNIPK